MIIAIIPAKGQSLRVPNKNISIINNLPLFMHSVKFAKRCGIMPVVSTDSQEIINICKTNKIRYVKETVNDSNMLFCIEQVLKKFPADKFVLMQPTSPIRNMNVFKKMIALSYKHKSVISVQDLKFIGFLDRKFYIAYRDQDTKRRFYHFDGNLLIADSNWVLKNKRLFSKDITYVKNSFPYYLQIDDKNEQSVIKIICEKLDF
jgi:CMP-N-acetylneuraminic acid synthetase